MGYNQNGGFNGIYYNGYSSRYLLKIEKHKKKVSFPFLSRFPKFFLEKIHFAANVFSLYFIWFSVYFNCSVLCCWFACFFSQLFDFFPRQIKNTTSDSTEGSIQDSNLKMSCISCGFPMFSRCPKVFFGKSVFCSQIVIFFMMVWHFLFFPICFWF